MLLSCVPQKQQKQDDNHVFRVKAVGKQPGEKSPGASGSIRQGRMRLVMGSRGRRRLLAGRWGALLRRWTWRTCRRLRSRIFHGTSAKGPIRLRDIPIIHIATFLKIG